MTDIQTGLKCIETKPTSLLRDHRLTNTHLPTGLFMKSLRGNGVCMQQSKEKKQQSINMKSPFLASLLENMGEKFSPKFPLCHLLQPMMYSHGTDRAKGSGTAARAKSGSKSDFWNFIALLTSTHIKASLSWILHPPTSTTRIQSSGGGVRRAPCVHDSLPGSLLSPQREGPVPTAHKYKYRIMKQQETALQE